MSRVPIVVTLLIFVLAFGGVAARQATESAEPEAEADLP